MIRQLATLNAIADTLNRAVDMRSALQDALARLIALMGLETGWIFLADPAATGIRWGKGYTLVAHHNLPPALDLSNPEAWHTNCECQGLCDRGELTGSYNEVTCSRLASVTGDRHGLGVHASTPLYAGDRILGILNVAATGWDRFTPEALALLTNVGRQMGIALDRARLFDMLQDQRIHEQAALLTFSNQLLGRHNLDDLMDYLVQAACVLLDADACALLLPASGGEMVFRAAHGWRGDPVADGRRVPAVGSLPVQVMRTQQPVIVPDVLEVDPDLMLPDWLSEEAFRGHAVVPLIANQRTAGVMLLNTREPRPDDDGATRFLQLLANQAAIALETARLHAEERERWRLADQLAVARRIQLTLLPIACPAVPGWEFQAVYQAAQQVGGDFYDFFALPGEPGRWGMVIADVADKGVPAALFMALSRTVIRTMAFSGRGAAAALMRANDLILNDTWSDLFLSAFYAILDTNTGELTYANAGHNRPMWWDSAAGRVREITTPGIVLGLFPAITIAQETITLAVGDQVIFYTDGLTEAMTEALDEFGEDRLAAILAAHGDSSAGQLTEEIIAAVEQFTGDAPQNDDLTMFIVRRTA
jgi:serine phosphatase RsbU (regulator of sigma subunit)